MKYEILSYDIWGNDIDGYEVNDTYRTGYYIEIDNPYDITDKEIKQKLYQVGYIGKNGLYEKIEIDNNCDPEYNIYLYLTAQKYAEKPFCELWRVE